MRRACVWLLLAVTGAALACAEWAGPSVGGPRLSIVPRFSTSGGTVLFNDLDRLHVIVQPALIGVIGQATTRSAGVIVDTIVPVDGGGNAVLTVSVLVVGSAQTYGIQLLGFRSVDSAVLYSGFDTVTVRPGIPARVDSVPVAYIGPCPLGTGCVVTVGPQNATLKQAASLAMTVLVDSPTGVPVLNVPARLTNITPALIDLGTDLTVSALSGTSCGPARIAADIQGSSDTLRLAVSAPVTVPALVFAGDSGGGLSSGVFCQNAGGSGRFHVSVNGTSGDVSPRYSPDRQRVAFTFRPPAGPTSPPNLLVVARWAGDTESVAVSDTSAYRPRWSPNGAHLAFACGDAFSSDQDVCVFLAANVPIFGFANAARIFVTDSVLSRPDGPSAFAWDPIDPDRLAFARDSFTADQKTTSALYSARFDGTAITRLTPAPIDLGAGVLQITDLDWSTRGDVIVFAALDTLFQRKLYTINRDGTGLRRLTTGLGSDSHPVVSPNGTQVLFLRDQGCSLDYWQIGIGGAGEQRVSDEALCDVSTTSLGQDWSPDGSEIVLVGRGAFGGFTVYRLPAGTTAATYVARRTVVRDADASTFLNDQQPSWRP